MGRGALGGRRRRILGESWVREVGEAGMSAPGWGYPTSQEGKGAQSWEKQVVRGWLVGREKEAEAATSPRLWNELSVSQLLVAGEGMPSELDLW